MCGDTWSQLRPAVGERGWALAVKAQPLLLLAAHAQGIDVGVCPRQWEHSEVNSGNFLLAMRCGWFWRAYGMEQELRGKPVAPVYSEEADPAARARDAIKRPANLRAQRQLFSRWNPARYSREQELFERWAPRKALLAGARGIASALCASDVIADVPEELQPWLATAGWALRGTVTHEQLCGLWLWGVTLYCAGVDCPTVMHTLIAAHTLRQTTKRISEAIKRCGLASISEYRLLVEVNALLGAPVAGLQRAADLAKRIDPVVMARGLCRLDPERVRAAIRRCYRRELGPEDNTAGAFDCADFGDFLDLAPIWMSAGSHSRGWGNFDARLAVSEALRRAAPTTSRLEWLLNTARDVVITAPPGGVVSQAQKPDELGEKERWLYSVDTINACRTAHVLDRLQGRWRNVEALLDPSRFGQPVIPAEEVGFCIDFEDFNSQHPLWALKAVFEELRPWMYGGYRESVEWCVSAWDNMHLTSGEPWLGTLPSGHRATSFINTVLNHAYTSVLLEDAAVAPEDVRLRGHTGDDVVLTVRSVAAAEHLLAHLGGDPGVRLQVAKQAVCMGSVEFLRFNGAGTRWLGYPCRAIAKLAAGSWVGDVECSGEATAATVCWGLERVSTRCGHCCGPLGYLGVHTIQRRCREATATLYKRMLQGDVCLSNMPNPQFAGERYRWKAEARLRPLSAEYEACLEPGLARFSAATPDGAILSEYGRSRVGLSLERPGRVVAVDGRYERDWDEAECMALSSEEALATSQEDWAIGWAEPTGGVRVRMERILRSASGVWGQQTGCLYVVSQGKCERSPVVPHVEATVVFVD